MNHASREMLERIYILDDTKDGGEELFAKMHCVL